MTERVGYGIGCGFEHPGRNAIWAGGGFGGGRFEMREIISLSEHRSGLGHGRGSESGGMGESGEAEELKHDEKKELRHCALSELTQQGSH